MHRCISVSEFGRIPRADVGAKLLGRLKKFDERHAREAKDWVFDWQYRDTIRAKNWVGVVEVPGLTVEIYPKVGTEISETDAAKQRAQRNLLYMLSLAGDLRVRQRDLAQLHTGRAPLLEALIAAFSNGLLLELGRGLIRNYVNRNENARFLRGKLLLQQQIKHNAAHRERVYVSYDDFTPDNPINQILKAAALRLAVRTRVPNTLRTLRQALCHFADVADREVRSDNFDRVHFDRSTERFRTLCEFARLVFGRESAGPSEGESETFSLLFPMEKVFEEFVGALIRKHASRLGLDRSKVHLQARNHPRWLLRAPDGGRFRLRPDVVIAGDGAIPSLILDTKWKRLVGACQQH